METPAINVMHIASGDLWAGAEVQLFTLCKHLKEFKTITLHVVLLNYGELEQKLSGMGVSVDVIEESKFNGLQIFKQIFKLAQTFKPDIIHTHRQKENILGSVVALLTKCSSVRTVHGASEHPSGFAQPIQKAQYLAEYLTGKYLDKKIISVSYELEKQLAATYSKKKVVTIENGVDTASLQSLSKKHALNSSTSHKVGIVGRLVPVKRVDLFIQVAKLWGNQYPNIPVAFYIYGDGPLRDQLEAQSQSQNTSTTIHFEGHCTNIHEKISNLDALLITSDHEGLPMTLLEAMALGTPIISNPVGGIPRVLKQGECGRLVESQTAQAFINELHHCLTEQDKTQKQTHKATQTIDQEYSANLNAENIYDLYKAQI